MRRPLATVQPASAGVAHRGRPGRDAPLAAVLRGEDDAGEFVAVGEAAGQVSRRPSG